MPTMPNWPERRVSSTNSQDAYLTDAEFRAWHGCLQFNNAVMRVLDAALTRAGHRRLRESRRTHNDVVRAHLTRRLTASQLATLGALWEAFANWRSVRHRVTLTNRD